MADVEKEVGVDFELEDHASPKLKAMHAAAEKAASLFEKASHVVGMFGSIAGAAAGAFSAHEVITGTLNYLGNIKRVVDITGLAAEKADGIVEAFSKAGLTSEQTINAMQMMSKAGAAMENQMENVGDKMVKTQSIAQRLGVDINKGPEQAFLQLAKNAERGTLSTAKLARGMRIPFDDARKMMLVLSKGPKAFEEAINELKAKGLAVTGDSLRLYAQIEARQNSIKTTWARITTVVGTTFLPLIDDMLKGVEGQLGKWLEHAKTFGETMSKFLREHYDMVKSISKVLLFNFALQKATGTGLTGGEGGQKGWVSKGLGAAGNVLGLSKFRGAGAAGTAAGMAFKEKREMQDVIGLFGGKGVTNMRNLMTSMGATFVRVRPVLMQFGRMTLIGAAIAAAVGLAVKGFEAIRDNVMGVRDYLSNTWSTMMARFAVIGDLLRPVTSIFSGDGVVGKFFTETVVWAIKRAADAADLWLHSVEAIIVVFQQWKNNMFSTSLSDLPKMFADAWETTQMMTQKKLGENNQWSKTVLTPKVPDGRGGTNFNFPNARFEIKQDFAEGFDPDRIAVAFTNDLAMLGERQLQSQFGHALGGG